MCRNEADITSCLKKLSILFILVPVLRGDESCDLPRYKFEDWIADHGRHHPDHPAMFMVPPSLHGSIGRFANMDSFVQEYKDEIVDTQPAYAQAGGQLGQQLWPRSRMGSRMSLGELAEQWNSSSRRGYYFSEFNCNSGLCRRFTEDAQVVRIINFKAVDYQKNLRVNFLVGGPGSGLPFHRHAETWQVSRLYDTNAKTFTQPRIVCRPHRCS